MIIICVKTKHGSKIIRVQKECDNTIAICCVVFVVQDNIVTTQETLHVYIRHTLSSGSYVEKCINSEIWLLPFSLTTTNTAKRRSRWCLNNEHGFPEWVKMTHTKKLLPISSFQSSFITAINLLCGRGEGISDCCYTTSYNWCKLCFWALFRLMIFKSIFIASTTVRQIFLGTHESSNAGYRSLSRGKGSWLWEAPFRGSGAQGALLKPKHQFPL